MGITRIVLALACLLPIALAAQQGKLAPQGQPLNQPPPGKGKLAAEPPPRGGISERCANFRREIRQIRRQEAEAKTTGEADQLALRRRQIEEQRGKAGC